MIKRLLLIALSFFFSISLNAQTGSGTVEFTSSGGHKVPITSQFTQLNEPNPANYTISGKVNDVPISFSSVTLGVEDYFINTTNGTLVMNNPGNPTIAFNGANIKDASAKLYTIQGQFLRNLPITTIDNSTLKTYTDFNGLSTGLYFIRLNNEFGSKSVKVINDNTPDIGPRSVSYSAKQQLQPAKKALISAKNTAGPNYRVSWPASSGTDENTSTPAWTLAGFKDVTINSGSGNNLTIDNVVTYGADETGDVLIGANNKGLGLQNIKVKIESTLENYKDSLTSGTESFVIFNDIPVLNPNNPTPYTITLTSLDETALETIVTRDMFQGQDNNYYEINMNEIPNTQDLTTIVYNYSTLSKDSGVTVELVKESDGSVLDTQVSDANGEVLFAAVPGETAVHTRVSKAGEYTKTNGTYTTPLVDHISEMKDTINVTTIPKFTYEDGTPVEASFIQMYKPLAYNTEALLDHWRVYFPATANRQQYLDHFSSVGSLLGINIIPSDTPFGTPSASQISGYNPYPQGREVYPGQIGSDITDYVGTSTGNGEKLLPNGNKITFYTTAFELGGLDWSRTDHEIGNALGFPTLTGNTTTFKTSRDTSALINFSFADSKHDKAIMPLWIQLGKRHYDSVDSQNRLIEYALTTNIQE